MATVIKSSENGTFQLTAELANGRTYYFIQDTKPNVGISIFVSNPLDDDEKRSVTVDASSLSTDDSGKLRERAALMVEASDFLSEVNEIVNA